MKAAFYNKYGSADVIEIGELEKPQILSDGVLVRVYASSVNPVDWKIRSGSLKLFTGKRFPKGLGFDISGKIVKVGEKVTAYKRGDEVYGKLSGLKNNAQAEYVSAKADDLALKPKNINFVEAAAVPSAALTAYQALLSKGGLAKNSKVLINGCSGGVGHFGLQIAKALGATVTGVCSTKNVALAKELGANKVIDYKKEKIVDSELQFDIFFDAVAKQSFGKAKPILKNGGKYITTLPSASLFLSVISGLLSTKKAKMINVKSNVKDLNHITKLIEIGKVKPIIEKVYKLEQIQEAHRHSETGRVVGKLAVSIN